MDESPKASTRRLFVALLLDPAWQESLALFHGRLRRLDAQAALRWVDPAGIHLTLRFLGAVPESRISALRAALGAALTGCPAPQLGPGELGAFPNWRHSRVVWLGLEEAGANLGLLQGRVEEVARQEGWPAEERPFRAHLTLARVRDPRRGLPRELASALERESFPGRAPSAQTQVALMQSHLSRHGARYEALQRWRLTTNRG